MIGIRIEHDWCHVTYTNDSTELPALQLACGYFVHGAEDTELFQQGKWDGRKTLFRKRYRRLEGMFPTGIYRPVISGLQILGGLQVNVVDNRVYPYHVSDIDKKKLSFEPRWYQEEGARIGLQHRRGIFKLPTAAGKTKLAVSLIATLDLPTLWITHEGALARTSQAAITDGIWPKPTVGMFSGDGEKVIKRYTVGLVQSLHRRLNEIKESWLQHVKVVIVDECHHGPSRTWYEVVMSIPAPFRFGISATPFERSDQSTMELEAATGPLIYTKDAEEVSQFLSRPNVEMIHLPYMKMSQFTWPGYYHEGIVHNEFRNRVILDRAMRSVRDGEPGLIFVASRDHGQLLFELLAQHIGLNGMHEYIHGDTPQYVRDIYYNKLRRKELRILIGTDGVAGEGQDIPSVRRVII